MNRQQNRTEQNRIDKIGGRLFVLAPFLYGGIAIPDESVTCTLYKPK